jgi:hypothetical protein
MPYADPLKNKECVQRYHLEHPEELRLQKRKSHLRRAYGITIEDLEQMRGEQNCSCRICGKSIANRACVDHDHKTGKIRGLLCWYCNVRIEALERPGWLISALAYLKEHAS